MKLHRHLTANEELLERFDFKRELSMESYLIENEGVLALDDDTYSEVDIIEDELTLKRIQTEVIVLMYVTDVSTSWLRIPTR